LSSLNLCLCPRIRPVQADVAPARQTRRLGFRLPGLVAPGGACLVWRQDRGTHSSLSGELPERRDKGAKCPRAASWDRGTAYGAVHQPAPVGQPRSWSEGCEATALTQEGLYLLNRTVTGWIEEELALGKWRRSRPPAKPPSPPWFCPPRPGLLLFQPRRARARNTIPGLSLPLRLVRGLPVLFGCFILVN
jgi:hypothetical protein